MLRLSKIILAVLAAVIILAVAAFASALFYIESASGRARVEAAIDEALGMPVKIGKLAVTLPATIRAEGVATLDDGSGTQPRIAAESLRGTIALKPLLSGQIEIASAVLHAPTFDWPQNAEGRWVWPDKTKAKAEPKEPAEPKAKSKPASKRKASVLARGIRLERGSVVMRNAKGQPLIQASGVTMEFSELSEAQLAGAVSAARLVWGERYAFENVRANLRYAGGVLELEQIDAAIFGGSVRGRYEMDTKSDGQPFKARIELRAVDLDPLAQASGWEDGEVAGRLSGEADLAGRTDRIARLEGPGRLAIEAGRFRKLEVFESIAKFLQLGELANFQPRETTAQFKLRDEKVFIDSLVFATDNLRISAGGVARFDGKLALDAQLSVPDRLVSSIPEIARGSFSKREDGRQALDFKISGKTNKPRTDLAERLIGGKVQDKIGDLLGSLFGAKPEKKDDKKKDADQRAPTPGEERR